MKTVRPCPALHFAVSKHTVWTTLKFTTILHNKG